MRCSRCLYNDNLPSVTLDDNGVCNYCHMHDRFEMEYPADKPGRFVLEKLADKLRRRGKGKKCDVIVGVSGGCDSSYLLKVATEDMGLRALAVHVDNGFNTDIAERNMRRVRAGLGVPLRVYKPDREAYREIYRAFLEAGLPDCEAVTDLTIQAHLYIAAQEAGCKAIFNAHSFRTEGLSPLDWLYMDGKYVESVWQAHGRGPGAKWSLPTLLPHLRFWEQMKYMLWHRIRRYRPLWYIDHVKVHTKHMLADRFGWTWYGGHHHENKLTRWYHTDWMPRFGIDQRANGYSALIRSGQMTRNMGETKMGDLPVCPPEIVDGVQAWLGADDNTWTRWMRQPQHTYKEYETYRELFRKLKPLWWLLYRLDLAPRSMYEKWGKKEI